MISGEHTSKKENYPSVKIERIGHQTPNKLNNMVNGQKSLEDFIENTEIANEKKLLTLQMVKIIED